MKRLSQKVAAAGIISMSGVDGKSLDLAQLGYSELTDTTIKDDMQHLITILGAHETAWNGPGQSEATKKTVWDYFGLLNTNLATVNSKCESVENTLHADLNGMKTDFTN